MAKLVQDYPAHCNPISAVEDFKEFFLCSKETLLGATLGLAAGREKANFLATSRDEIEDPFFFIDPAVSFSCEIGSIKLNFPFPRKRNPAIRSKKEDVTPSSMWEIVCFSFEVRGRRIRTYQVQNALRPRPQPGPHRLRRRLQSGLRLGASVPVLAKKRNKKVRYTFQSNPDSVDAFSSRTLAIRATPSVQVLLGFSERRTEKKKRRDWRRGSVRDN